MKTIHAANMLILAGVVLTLYGILGLAFDRPNNQEYKGLQINDIEFCKVQGNENLAIFVNDKIVYHLDCN